jgi:hypothetical protein
MRAGEGYRGASTSLPAVRFFHSISIAEAVWSGPTGRVETWTASEDSKLKNSGSQSMVPTLSGLVNSTAQSFKKLCRIMQLSLVTVWLNAPAWRFFNVESCSNHYGDVARRGGNRADCYNYRNLSVRPNDHFQDDERFGWQSNHGNDGHEAGLSADGLGLRPNDHFRDDARPGWQSNHGNDAHEAGLSADGPERL